YPVWKSEDGNILFYPLSGRFVFPGVRKTLPSDIRANIHFNTLFPGVTKAKASRGGDIWSFTDKRGYKTHVSMDKEKITIQQKRDAEWVEYVPSSHLEHETEEDTVSLLGSRYMQKTTVA